MSMTEPIRPVVLVTRATCPAGGSVLRRIRERGQFDVRAMSRTPDSAGAGAIAGSGVQLVAGDLDDVDALRNAMAGCYGVFGYVDADSCDTSWQRVLNLLDAGADAGVGYVVVGVDACAVDCGTGTADEVSRMAAYARSVGVPVAFVYCESGRAEYMGDAVAGAFEERVEAMLRS